MEAYVLVQTEVGRADEVARSASGVAGVVAAEAVTGPYDVVVRIVADAVDELGSVVLGGLAAVDGVVRTVTCTVMGE